MQVHTLDQTTIINELHLGNGIGHAVQEGRRADFALLVSMFSNDVRDAVPVEKIDDVAQTEQVLRSQFGLSEPQPLRSNASSYELSAAQAEGFHKAGLASAKLNHYLKPDALAYMPEDTANLPEEVYHNLSGHERRALKSPNQTLMPEAGLYNELVKARRTFQVQCQA